MGGDSITQVGGEDGGGWGEAGCQCPRQEAVAHSEQRGHRDGGGEGGEHQAEEREQLTRSLRSVLKVYTHTHT